MQACRPLLVCCVVLAALLPPAAVNAQDVLSVPATFQPFEGGFMTWRGDTGQITVYSHAGRVWFYEPQTYGSLPDDMIRTPAPAGRFLPVMGFGRVWGNFPSARAALGWATGTELSYTMVIIPQAATSVVSLPGGQQIVVDATRGTWSASLPTPPAPVLPTPLPVTPVATDTDAAYQPYDGGFAVWTASTGTIFVFFEGGTFRIFPISEYVMLPDNPVTEPTPRDRVRPGSGFGRVWGGFADVRLALGWATAVEQGYTARLTRSGADWREQACLTLPDGRAVAYQRVGYSTLSWTYTNVC